MKFYITTKDHSNEYNFKNLPRQRLKTNEKQKPSSFLTEADCPYELESFKINEQIEDWVVNDSDKKALFLVGPSGLGKSEYIKSLLVKKYKLQGHVFPNKKSFALLDQNQAEFFICQNFDFSKLDISEIRHLIDPKNPGGLRIPYKYIPIPTQLSRVFVLNKIDEIIKPSYTNDEKFSILRKITIVEINESCYKTWSNKELKPSSNHVNTAEKIDIEPIKKLGTLLSQFIEFVENFDSFSSKYPLDQFEKMKSEILKLSLIINSTDLETPRNSFYSNKKKKIKIKTNVDIEDSNIHIPEVLMKTSEKLEFNRTSFSLLEYRKYIQEQDTTTSGFRRNYVMDEIFSQASKDLGISKQNACSEALFLFVKDKLGENYIEDQLHKRKVLLEKIEELETLYKKVKK